MKHPSSAWPHQKQHAERNGYSCAAAAQLDYAVSACRAAPMAASMSMVKLEVVSAFSYAT